MSDEKNSTVSGIEKLRVHDHLCLIYDTREEQLAVNVSFISKGLDKKEKCICITDENASATVTNALRREGTDPDRVIKSGQLRQFHAADTYLKHGRFDPDSMIGFLEQEAVRAREEGYAALRVICEMTGIMDSGVSSEKIIEYETRLNLLSVEHDMITVCQYDSHRVREKTAQVAIMTHPAIIYRGVVSPNFYNESMHTALMLENIISRRYDQPDAGRGPYQYESGDERLKQEVQKRIQAEGKLHGIMRAIRSLNECNRALLHVDDEAELMDIVCRSIVETGGYRLAWVGFAEHDEQKTVRPVAYAGSEENYLENAFITWGSDAHGQSPVSIAIRTGTPCMVKDVRTDASFDPWCSEASKMRYASSIALPLIVNNGTFGALNIYAGEPAAFTDEVNDLFNKLANDLALRIETLRIRTAKEKAERELERNEVYFRSIIESLQDSVTVFDYDGTIRYRNSGFGDTGGYRPEDLIGKTAVKMIHPDDRQRVIDDFTRGIRTPGRTTVSEFRYRFKDGSWHILEAQIKNLMNVPGVKGVVVNSRDVTGRKQLEDKLRQEIADRERIEAALKSSEERFRAMVQNSSDVVTVIDEHGLLKYVSPSIERLLGYVPEELIGKNAFDLLHPDDMATALKAMSDMFTDPDHPYTIEVRYRHSNGSYRNFEIRGTNQLQNGSINGIVGIARDITEQKQVESSLREELEITTNLLMLSDVTAGITDVGTLLEKVIKPQQRVPRHKGELPGIDDLVIETIKSLSATVEAKSAWIAGHSERVTHYAVLLGKQVGLDTGMLKSLEIAGFLHDIGKIGIYTILDKSSALTKREMQLIRGHSSRGAGILSPIQQLKVIIPAVKYHHEAFNGTGYPEGLKGGNIPLLARILSIADSVGAMTADRPYRKARPETDIVRELNKYSGTQFDPRLVKAFLPLYRAEQM